MARCVGSENKGNVVVTKWLWIIPAMAAYGAQGGVGESYLPVEAMNNV